MNETTCTDITSSLYLVCQVITNMIYIYTSLSLWIQIKEHKLNCEKILYSERMDITA